MPLTARKKIQIFKRNMLVVTKFFNIGIIPVSGFSAGKFAHFKWELVLNKLVVSGPPVNNAFNILFKSL